MSPHESTDFLTPLVPVSYENDILDRQRSAEWFASGTPGIDKVVISDIGAVKTRVGKRVK